MKCYQVAAFGAPLLEAVTPTATPGGAEVLLEVVAAGVCHSDLHIWEGGYDLGHWQTVVAEGPRDSAAFDDGPPKPLAGSWRPDPMPAA